MLQRLGTKDWREGIIWLCLILLVVLTPTGNESTRPFVLAIYRTLLLLIIVFYAVDKDRSHLPRISRVFTYGLVIVAGASLISILQWQGSLFESFYWFYEKVLFVGAFVAVAHHSRERPLAWRHALLGFIVLIGAGYIAGALIIGKRPLFGPFVNPNYLASFILPALGICAATVVLASSLRLRIAAAGAGLFLYYGISQTASRGATLAGLALLGLAGFRAARRRGLSVLRMGLVTALLVVLTAAFNPLLVRKFVDRGERDPYNYQRGEIWLGTLKMIAEYPFLGVGPGHFSYIAKQFTPSVESTIARHRRYPNIAHSEYLQFIAEIGVPAALLLFALGAWVFSIGWQRAESVSEGTLVQESALLAAAGLAVHALVDNNWTVPVMAAGLATISQADLLPYGTTTARQLGSPTWRNAFALLVIGVWLNVAVIPSIGLYFNEVGHEAHVANDFKHAERYQRLALAILPNHPVLLDNLGIIYMDHFIETRRPEYLDRAEFLFSDAMQQNPSYDLAVGHLETALMQRLTFDPQKDRKIHERIVEVDRHFLEVNPFNPFVRKNLAEALYNVGDRHEAAQELLKAIEIEPNFVPAYLRLADWYDEAGRQAESEQYRNRAIQVVNLYKDKQSLDAFEGLLLGRPSPKQQ